MKTLSTALSAALGAPVQQPALLIEVAFNVTRRWSSFATVTWNSVSWSKEDASIENLAVGALAIKGTLILGNADDTIGALVMSEGVQDRAINLWGYDAAATAFGDVVWLASAVGASAEVGARDVRIELRHPAEFTLSPRTFINTDTFGPLLPSGTVLNINGRDMRLQRRD